MMGLLSIIAVGFFLGMRHATDPDHVIAVSTIVTRQPSLARSAWIGIFWGIGHTLTIFLIGAAIILFNVVIPPRIGLSMELSVSVMLIILGVINVAGFLRSLPAFSLPSQAGSSAAVHVHPHSHGDYVHTHAHAHSPEAHPHRPEQTPLARLDQVFGKSGIYQFVRPLVVGIVHGLAGSAAVALLVLTAIRNSYWAVAYLLVFGVGTIAGMMLITLSLASTLRFVGRRQQLARHLALASGMLSLAFGLMVAYQICMINGLFTGHPHWTPR